VRRGPDEQAVPRPVQERPGPEAHPDQAEAVERDELQAFVDGKIASFKAPKRLAFVETMPASGPSKADRGPIGAEFAASTDGCGSGLPVT